ncbi:hypothetical protein L7F22_025897 [Adiantum nelumboides]|nr:hypothetical protein [Adiantum nelumboides]
MADAFEKFGEKLHMDGHRQDKPAPHVGYGGAAATMPYAGGAPPAAPQQHGGIMQKTKQKIKGCVEKMKEKTGHVADNSSSARSGGRAKKDML